MPQQVIVEIDTEGEVKVEAKGVIGTGCKALTRAMEQALGSTVAEKLKPEFHQRQQQHASQGPNRS